ncbi:MAG: inositol monophosphatase [Clostridia bacterium]|nr:inositol monophosphatase [Clostridia bacterium]
MNIQESLAKIAWEAGEILLSADRPEVLITKPGNANFVTEYDLRVQRFLEERLSALLPEATFIGEEDTETHTPGRLCWIVDPIDGTTNFLHGMKSSAISIALCEGGETQAGLILQPYLREFYYAEAGRGATCNGDPIRVSNRPVEEALVHFGTAPYHREHAPHTFGLLQDLFATVADLRRTGSAAIDLIAVAAGRADGFFEPSLAPWDFGAGKLILTEAGGKISDMKGSPLPIFSSASLLCGNPAVYDWLLEKILKHDLPY